MASPTSTVLSASRAGPVCQVNTPPAQKPRSRPQAGPDGRAKEHTQSAFRGTLYDVFPLGGVDYRSLLELRLQWYQGQVKHHVTCESSTSFYNRPLDRLEEESDFKVPEHVSFGDAHVYQYTDNERADYDAHQRYLELCDVLPSALHTKLNQPPNDGDYVLIGDVDHMVKSSALQQAQHLLRSKENPNGACVVMFRLQELMFLPVMSLQHCGPRQVASTTSKNKPGDRPVYVDGPLLTTYGVLKQYSVSALFRVRRTYPVVYQAGYHCRYFAPDVESISRLMYGTLPSSLQRHDCLGRATLTRVIRNEEPPCVQPGTWLCHSSEAELEQQGQDQRLHLWQLWKLQND